VSGPIPERVARFREAYRAEHIGRTYSGWLHFAATNVGAIAAIAFAASRVVSPSWAELASLPVSFVIANFGEYFGHRGPMHHRRRGASILFERHTLQHHRFYTREAMHAESSRDFKMVLFPPVMLFFFLGVLAVPIGALLTFAISPNVGWLFGATAVSYFLLYEWFHFAHHLPAESRIGRHPVVVALRRAHALHHDPDQMTRVNFNVTIPIADLVMGTYARAEPRPADQDEARSDAGAREA
jgi:hypothetical protein